MIASPISRSAIASGESVGIVCPTVVVAVAVLFAGVGSGVDEAIVTHANWHGYSSAVVCEHGRGLNRALRLVDAQLAVAMVNPGEERGFLVHGFVPTPRTIRFIGKRLADDAPPLPKRRNAWHFTLGDLDFF